MLASIGDDYFVTDSSWKCTTTYYANWTQPSFDDGDWPSAVFISYNRGNHPVYRYTGRTPIPGISRNAGWIWTSRYRPPYDRTVYCRGRLRTLRFMLTFNSNYDLVLLAVVDIDTVLIVVS